MELKKSPKADLENKKLLFTEIGLIVTLLVILFAFEWKTSETKVATLDTGVVAQIAEEEMVPITTEEPPAPPEAPKQPVVSDIIDIVDDDVIIEEEILINTEDDNTLGVDIKDYVEEEIVEELIEEEIPFAIIEEKPTFNGGDPAVEFQKWVYSRLEYPEVARDNNIQGRVIISFLVDTDGSIKDIKVLRGVDPSLDNEAVRVIAGSPKWTPGKQRNKPAKVRFTFPIVFQLR